MLVTISWLFRRLFRKGIPALLQFAIDNISLNLTNGASVPEPASLALLSLGLLGVTAMRKRRQV